MPTYPHPGSWQQVDSRADFAAYLRHLAAGGEGPGREQSIGDFLWGWVGLLGLRHNGTDLLHEEAPSRPGWRGLAYQLATARTVPPAYNCVLADSRFTEPAEVDSPNELRMYVATLAMDLARARRERRAAAERGARAGDGDGTPEGLLDSWAAWVAADSPLHARIEPVGWRSVALQLSAARGYA